MVPTRPLISMAACMFDVMFNSLDAYCVPYRRVCDGNYDCIYGEDEMLCNKYSCAGMFHCKNTFNCIHVVEVCDGNWNCPLMDDELFCDHLPCPPGCTCLGLAVMCLQIILTQVPEITAQTEILYLTYHNLTVGNTSLFGLSLLRKQYNTYLLILFSKSQ